MKILAVIVTYNPNPLSLNKLLHDLQKQSVEIVVVDNNSSNKIPYKDCFYLDENKGIAFAQNLAIKYAQENYFEYIVFFDQDSFIPDGYIKDLYNDYQYLTKQGTKVGAIGPRFIDERYNFYYKTISVNKYGFRKKHDISNIVKPLPSTLLISSGSLISVSTLKDVGYMRDHYFIDYVDTEWCLRAEAKGYTNFVSSSAVMKHTIGDDVLQFKLFNVPVHSAFRRYFRVRNAFFMMREPHVPLILSLREIIFNFIHQMILICFQGNKLDYMKSYIKGLKDGIMMGKRKDV